MEKMSFYMFSAALITLIFAFGFHLLYLWKQRFGLGTLGTMFTWLGAVFLLGAWAFRWAATGHAPYSNMYEYSMSFALGTTVAYAVVERKYHARTLGAMVLPVAIGLLAYARTLPSEIEPLIPALQNQELLTIHVAMAIISYGVFAVAFGAAVAAFDRGASLFRAHDVAFHVQALAAAAAVERGQDAVLAAQLGVMDRRVGLMAIDVQRPAFAEVEQRERVDMLIVAAAHEGALAVEVRENDRGGEVGDEQLKRDAALAIGGVS